MKHFSVLFLLLLLINQSVFSQSVYQPKAEDINDFLVLDQGGSTYFATNKGLFYKRRNTVKFRLVNNIQLALERVFAVQGEVWVITTEGIIRSVKNNRIFKLEGIDKELPIIYDLKVYNQSILFLATSLGIYKILIDSRSISHYPYFIKGKNKVIQEIFALEIIDDLNEATEPNLWIGTEGGLWSTNLDLKTFRQIEDKKNRFIDQKSVIYSISQTPDVVFLSGKAVFGENFEEESSYRVDLWKYDKKLGKWSSILRDNLCAGTTLFDPEKYNGLGNTNTSFIREGFKMKLKAIDQNTVFGYTENFVFGFSHLRGFYVYPNASLLQYSATRANGVFYTQNLQSDTLIQELRLDKLYFNELEGNCNSLLYIMIDYNTLNTNDINELTEGLQQIITEYKQTQKISDIYIGIYDTKNDTYIIESTWLNVQSIQRLAQKLINYKPSNKNTLEFGDDVTGYFKATDALRFSNKYGKPNYRFLIINNQNQDIPKWLNKLTRGKRRRTILKNNITFSIYSLQNNSKTTGKRQILKVGGNYYDSTWGWYKVLRNEILGKPLPDYSIRQKFYYELGYTRLLDSKQELFLPLPITSNLRQNPEDDFFDKNHFLEFSLGYQLNRVTKYKGIISSVEVGLSFESLSLSYSLLPNSTTTNSTSQEISYFDRDGTPYTRLIELNNIVEQTKFQLLSPTLKYRASIALSNRFTFQAKVGLGYQLFYQGQYRVNEGVISYKGAYTPFQAATSNLPEYQFYNDTLPFGTRQWQDFRTTSHSLDRLFLTGSIGFGIKLNEYWQINMQAGVRYFPQEKLGFILPNTRRSNFLVTDDLDNYNSLATANTVSRKSDYRFGISISKRLRSRNDYLQRLIDRKYKAISGNLKEHAYVGVIGTPILWNQTVSSDNQGEAYQLMFGYFIGKRLALEAKVGKAAYNFSTSSPLVENNITAFDIDFVQHQQLISATNITENHQLESDFISLGARMHFPKNSIFRVSFWGGLKYMMPKKWTYTAEGQLSYRGVYDSYTGNISNLESYGFQNIAISSIDRFNTSIPSQDFLSVTGGFNFHFRPTLNIPKLTILLGLNFEQFLTENRLESSLKGVDDYVISTSNRDYQSLLTATNNNRSKLFTYGVSVGVLYDLGQVFK